LLITNIKWIFSPGFKLHSMAIDFAEISFLEGGAAPKNFIISLVFLSFISSRSINFHVFLNIKFNFIKMLC
jgi:hypothetical protein